MTRRRAQVILLVCAVAWILFGSLVVPGIVESAYEGKSHEILNRMIGGRSAHPVEFYLRRWRIASWTALAVAMATLLPLVSFTPGQLLKAWRKYWFRPTPVLYLALLRIIAVGAQLIMLLVEDVYNLRHFAGLASLPDSMYKPLPVLQLFLLPFGLDARPSLGLLTVSYWITVVAGMGALLGLKSRFSLLIFAAGNTFLQAFAYSFGDLHHREALMMVTLWLLALSPAGGGLSLDSYVASWQSSLRQGLRKKSIFAAWPILLVQNLLGLVYLDSALRKIYAGGADWVNGYTLQYYLYSDASRRGSAFGLWLAQQHTLACVLSWITILWEGTFFLVLIFPRLVWLYLPVGIALHAGMGLAGVAWFPQFIALYAAFIPLLWNYGGRSLAVKWGMLRGTLETETQDTFREGQQPIVLFDGVCNLCNRWVQFVINRDHRMNIRFAPLQSEAGRDMLMKHGLRPDCLDSIVLIEQGAPYIRSDAALRITQYLSGAWPAARVLLLLPRALRDWCYDAVARNRYKWFGKQNACMVPSSKDHVRFVDQRMFSTLETSGRQL
jgi:predicted DCC family thiol-disulfide oxidoreductase YuxK